MIAIFANAAQLNRADDTDGSYNGPAIVRQVSVTWNIMVSLCGMLMASLALYGQMRINDECPPDTSCDNWAAKGVGFVGIALFWTGIVGIIGAVKQLRMLLVLVNFIYLGLALCLFVAGVALAVVAGSVDTVNSKAEKHFPELKAQFEQKDPSFCQTVNEAGAVVPMTNPECRAKIAERVEESIFVVAVVAGSIALFFGIVIFGTYHMIHVMRKDETDDDKEDEAED